MSFPSGQTKISLDCLYYRKKETIILGSEVFSMLTIWARNFFLSICQMLILLIEIHHYLGF